MRATGSSGPVSAEGKPPDHGQIQRAGLTAGNVAQERIVRSWVELAIDGDDVPINGHWRLEGRGRVSGQLQEIIIQADLVFTRVGTPMTIMAP
jgi:hypothetical protein